MSIIKFKREQSFEEVTAKRQAREKLEEWVKKATYNYDDIQDLEDYWAMLIYSFLYFSRDENPKVTARAIQEFLKKKWELKPDREIILP